MEDYSVEAPKMSDIAAAKKAGRIIPQIKGYFYIMNSIHQIEKSRPICSKLRSTKNGWNSKTWNHKKL